MVERGFSFVQTLVRPGRGRVQIKPPVGQAMGEDAADRAPGAQQIALRCLGAELAGPKLVRRQIDADSMAGLPVRRDLQHGRAAEAAMGKEKFLPKAPRSGGGDHLGRDSRQTGKAREVLRSEGEGDERRPAGLNGQAELLRDLVAERGGSHLRNRQAPGGDDQGAPREQATVGF